MPASAFELFRVGIGPSSSHTVAPMRAANEVARRLRGHEVDALDVRLHGSLALTARGHGTDRALISGLAGHDPETVEPDVVRAAAPSDGFVAVTGQATAVEYRLVLDTHSRLPGHPNAMRFTAVDARGQPLLDCVFRSLGGGFLSEDGVAARAAVPPAVSYSSADELLAHAAELGSIAAVAAANEAAWHPASTVEPRLLALSAAMEESIERGLQGEGELPGDLRVRRRAAALHRQLTVAPATALEPIEWLGLWAIAVNEENASGGRIVTAPTNGAAGILPAVLRYGRTFERLDDDGIVRALLAATAIGGLIKDKASISGAEVGCQGEVGSAAAMAAAGLAEALGGRPAQVANAAEIALEHHLGMTCDPIGGLVQVPCIERNALGATKAVTAARLALRGDGRHIVSLDQVIDAMRRTGQDMHENYRESSRGGLAVCVPAC